MTNKIEVVPCFFCGKKPEKRKNKNKLFTIQCKSTLCPEYLLYCIGKDETEVIKHWNKEMISKRITQP